MLFLRYLNKQYHDILMDTSLSPHVNFELITTHTLIKEMENPNLLLIDMRPPVRHRKNTILTEKNKTISLFDAMIGDYDEINNQLELIREADTIVIFDEESTEITRTLLSYKLYEKLCDLKMFEYFDIYLLEGGFKMFEPIYKKTISKDEERIQINQNKLVTPTISTCLSRY